MFPNGSNPVHLAVGTLRRDKAMPGSRSAADVALAVPISEVWRMLSGGPIRHGRGRAFWRNGDGWNVSLVDERGVWHDHRDHVGGGVLDLIAHVNGGTRADALKWLADVTGTPLDDDRPPDPAAKAALARDTPAARLWRRAMLDIYDEILTNLKAGLFDPMLPQPEDGEIKELEGLYAFVRDAPEAGLVFEYRRWRDMWPATTVAMIRVARSREQADRRALERFLSQIEPLGLRAAK